MRYIFLLIPLFFLFIESNAQGCCSGGAGSPIAGGTSQGVLRAKQVEFAINYNYVESNKFLIEDRDTVPLFENLSSDYLYFRTGYGLSKKLTLEVSAGYFLNKKIDEIDSLNREDIESDGFGDLIIFPRYDVYFKSTTNRKTEITVGVGCKIPLGSHIDSNVVFTNPVTGDEYYATSPPTVQRTNGSLDFMLYLFALHGFNRYKLNFFTNALYIKKGYNSLGQKFGDYASVGLFMSKIFYRKLGVTTQLKAEWIGKLQSAKYIDMIAYYNVYPESTGGRKLFFVPQLSYTFRDLTLYGLADIPLYQYVNGNQVGSEINFTFGISLRLSQLCDKIL